MSLVYGLQDKLTSFFKANARTFKYIGITGIIIATLIIFKSILLQLLGLLALGSIIVIGFYYLFRIAFGLIALAIVIAGIFMAGGLIYGLFTMF
ncbi:hypothetical protein ACQCWI_28305 [Bacillus thuringiensis]|uniref:hypothetical protein n=1 Tax=Bacillus thuringiensis TaxID=1428 RepID=UPI003CEF8044